jgi:phospholipase C
VNAATTDYIPHHNWFQYYASTANPQHTRPSSIAAIGSSVQADGKTAEPANHQYDSDDFFAAVKAGNFPSVSFLKAPAAQDAHAGYSDPLDEQAFVTKVVNFLQQQPDWKNTAVIVTYDDSDGWYDHAYTAPTHASSDAVDQVNGNGACGTGGTTGVNGGTVNGRCGPGVRIPLVVISPYAKQNYVDHTMIDQASVVRFIEDNWLGGQRIGGGSFDATAGDMRGLLDFSSKPNTAPLYLDPTQGTVLSAAPSI